MYVQVEKQMIYAGEIIPNLKQSLSVLVQTRHLRVHQYYVCKVVEQVLSYIHPMQKKFWGSHLYPEAIHNVTHKKDFQLHTHFSHYILNYTFTYTDN